MEIQIKQNKDKFVSTTEKTKVVIEKDMITIDAPNITFICKTEEESNENCPDIFQTNEDGTISAVPNIYTAQFTTKKD